MSESFDMVIRRLADVVHMLIDRQCAVNGNSQTLDTVRRLDSYRGHRPSVFNVVTLVYQMVTLDCKTHK